MAITFNAEDCPAVQTPGDPIWLADVSDPPTSESFSTALAASGTSSKLNRNAKAADIAHRYGAGAYAIGYGLGLSAGAGLTVEIADGQAVIDGIVEVKDADPLVVTADGDNWIWLKSDGTLVAQFDTIAKPTGNCVCLGCAQTDGSSVTAIDTSGVVSYRGGLPYRETADAAEPGDTPASSLLFLTRTQGGLYLWDGDAYVPLEDAAIGSTPLTFEFTTAGAHTWTKPTTGNYKMARIICIGGGGGGGSGRKGAAASQRAGGGGGTGGALSIRDIPLSFLGATEAVTVGAGGAGGAASSAGNGNAGTNGGASLFGTAPNAWVRAGGGLGGNGGAAGNTTAVSGAMGSFQSATGGAVSGAVPSSPSNSPGGAGSGGAGGSITSADVASAGAQGGGNGTVVGNATSLATSAYVGGAGGAVDNPGTAGASMVGSGLEPGPGGGGGGSSITGVGRTGGAGGRYGGGGGGGGASLTTAGDSGAGGAGADGAVFVIVY